MVITRRFTALVCALVLASSTLVPAQSATSSISGTVIDSAGGAIPGAAVVVKNESGVSFEAITNGEGIFNVPNVSPGVYTVSVSLTGFKTAVISNVRVATGTPAAVKATPIRTNSVSQLARSEGIAMCGIGRLRSM